MTKEEGPYDIIVIGGGPAGISAAVYASRAKLNVLVVDKDIGQGAMGGRHMIANYPGFPEPIEAEELLRRMRIQAERLGTRIVQDKVIYTDLRGEEKIVSTPEATYRARTVIVASGSMGREPTLEGEADFQGRGAAYCAVCDGAYFEGKTVAVTGQLDRVTEELELISRYAEKIFFITPSGKVTDDERKALSRFSKVKVLEGSRISRLIGSERLEAVMLKKEKRESKLEVDGIFIYLQGNRPVVDFIVDDLQRGVNGCIHPGSDMNAGSPGVFAAGDVTCRKVRQISLAVAEGCRCALSAEAYILGKEKSRSQWGT